MSVRPHVEFCGLDRVKDPEWGESSAITRGQERESGAGVVTLGAVVRAV